MVYIVKGSLARKIEKSPELSSELDLFSNPKSVGIPMDQIKSEVVQSLEDSMDSGREQGGHAMKDGTVIRWDEGGEPRLKKDKIILAIRPFLSNHINVEPDLEQLLVFWHVHAKIEVNGVQFGSSSPSSQDVSSYKRYESKGYSGGAFIIGARDKKVNIYKQKKITSVKWEEFKDL